MNWALPMCHCTLTHVRAGVCECEARSHWRVFVRLIHPFRCNSFHKAFLSSWLSLVYSRSLTGAHPGAHPGGRTDIFGCTTMCRRAWCSRETVLPGATQDSWDRKGGQPHRYRPYRRPPYRRPYRPVRPFVGDIIRSVEQRSLPDVYLDEDDDERSTTVDLDRLWFYTASFTDNRISPSQTLVTPSSSLHPIGWLPSLFTHARCAVTTARRVAVDRGPRACSTAANACRTAVRHAGGPVRHGRAAEAAPKLRLGAFNCGASLAIRKRWVR